ncbi:hypothetical protein GTQ43_31600 [Nostoc sp. KVJ3]|uniref:hypothetical protein n=1 Tax=Nostoc sp. KVJ3 TaxID=457945 RepID=UPI002238D50E|nr:hypothetical protein [Nostoc sp. KVJ3]MCW5318131.1 hypothetical protein [Nostoc sp. KVJ3]
MFKGFGGPKKKSVLKDNELTTGIVQHPVTGLWQTWISFTGNDIQCITAHANQDDADRVAKQIADAWSEGKYKTQQEVTAFIQSLPTDAVIDPLPQNIVMQLSQQALSAKK